MVNLYGKLFPPFFIVYISLGVATYRGFAEPSTPVSSLVKALKNPNEVVRAKAAGALGRLRPKTKAAILALIDALKDKSSYVREMAGEALDSIGSEAAPELVKALVSGDFQVRLAAMGCLNLLASYDELNKDTLRSALPILLKDLTDNVPVIRMKATSLLGYAGVANTIPALVKVLNTDENEYVRMAAATSLGSFHSEAKRVIPPLVAAIKAGKGEDDVANNALLSLENLGFVAVPTIAELLSNPAVYLRLRSAETLGNLGETAKDAVMPLAKALEDGNEDVRRAAVDALGQIGPTAKASIPALVKALNDPASTVICGAALALHAIDPSNRAGVQALVNLLETGNDSNVRCDAAIVLAEYGSNAKPALQALLRRLADKKVQPHAVKALRRLGPDAEKATVQILAKLLTSSDESLRLATAKSLAGIGPKADGAVERLVAASRDKSAPVRGAVIQALTQIGPRAKVAIPSLRWCMTNDQAPLVRLVAAAALTRIDPTTREGVNVLLDAVLNSTEWEVKKTAVNLLANAGSRAKCAIPSLIQIVRKPPMTSVPEEAFEARIFQRRAIWALVQLAPQADDVVPALISALKDENKATSFLAAEALHKMGQGAKSSVPELIRLLQDPDPGMRRKAAELLGKLAPFSIKAIPPLIEAINDRDRKVRFSAGAALEKIRESTREKKR